MDDNEISVSKSETIQLIKANILNFYDLKSAALLSWQFFQTT